MMGSVFQLEGFLLPSAKFPKEFIISLKQRIVRWVRFCKDPKIVLD